MFSFGSIVGDQVYKLREVNNKIMHMACGEFFTPPNSSAEDFKGKEDVAELEQARDIYQDLADAGLFTERDYRYIQGEVARLKPVVSLDKKSEENLEKVKELLSKINKNNFLEKTGSSATNEDSDAFEGVEETNLQEADYYL